MGVEDEEAGLGALIVRLFDDGRRLVQAEIAVHVATIRQRIAHAKVAVALLIVAVVLVNAALIVLLWGVAAQLALLVGPLGGAAITFAGVAIIAFILIRVAVARLTPAVAIEEAE